MNATTLLERVYAFPPEAMPLVELHMTRARQKSMAAYSTSNVPDKVHRGPLKAIEVTNGIAVVDIEVAHGNFLRQTFYDDDCIDCQDPRMPISLPVHVPTCPATSLMTYNVWAQWCGTHAAKKTRFRYTGKHKMSHISKGDLVVVVGFPKLQEERNGAPWIMPAGNLDAPFWSFSMGSSGEDHWLLNATQIERSWSTSDTGIHPHDFIEPLPVVKIHAPGSCPKCGARGVFRLMSLQCPVHGMYGGC